MYVGIRKAKYIFQLLEMREPQYYDNVNEWCEYK